MRIERHAHGPRLFVYGRRVHEIAAGTLLAAVIAVGLLAGAWRPSTPVALAALVAVWLVVKDWRDAFPALRDTGSWRIGAHRPFAPLRPARRSDGLHAIAALASLVAAAANIASAVTPDAPARARLLVRLAPLGLPDVAHAAALATGVALAVVGVYLFKRRRRAMQLALVLLVLVGWLDLLKGLDVEEALLSWAAAGLLFWGRDAFCVRHDPLELGTTLRRILAWLAAVSVAAVVAVASATGWHAGVGATLRETAALLALSGGPVPIAPEFSWVPLGVGVLGIGTVLVVAAMLFRPLSAVAVATGDDRRGAAFRLVRAHGQDTLSFFKLRGDTRHFFSTDGRAFVGYAVSGRVLLVSGDPVGPADALPGLLAELCRFAESRGLGLGVVGASRATLDLYRAAGLRALYLGDEAIVDTAAFTLEGRSIRKVRQSVNRLVTAGYTVECAPLSRLDPETTRALERISTAWLGGTPERGFSMALELVGCPHAEETEVLVARDGSGAVRGFLHLVPTYGRAAMSLSAMRRDRSAPNGLMEFLIVRAIEELGARGIEEVSLNFAAFARWMHAPRNGVERLLGSVATAAGSFFQIDSLYRFNAKFFPRWSPRYLLFERPLDLPRVGLAALKVEGQLPQLPLPGRARLARG